MEGRVREYIRKTGQVVGGTLLMGLVACSPIQGEGAKQTVLEETPEPGEPGQGTSTPLESATPEPVPASEPVQGTSTLLENATPEPDQETTSTVLFWDLEATEWAKYKSYQTKEVEWNDSFLTRQAI